MVYEPIQELQFDVTQRKSGQTYFMCGIVLFLWIEFSAPCHSTETKRKIEKEREKGNGQRETNRGGDEPARQREIYKKKTSCAAVVLAPGLPRIFR